MSYEKPILLDDSSFENPQTLGSLIVAANIFGIFNATVTANINVDFNVNVDTTVNVTSK